MPATANAPRLTRTFVQRIAAPPEEVFPLLCPVRERDWLPGWDCRMIHSNSGVAERGAVFETVHPQGTTLWLITEHEGPRRVAFARWQPDGLLVHIQIALGQHHDGDTAVAITYTYTAVSGSGHSALAALTEEAWLKQMSFWESSMNQWLRTRAAA